MTMIIGSNFRFSLTSSCLVWWSILIRLFGLAIAEDTDRNNTFPFACGDYDNAMELDMGYFGSVLPQANCQYSGEWLIPKTVHWHIRILGPEFTPKYAMYPTGIVKPMVKDNKLQFEWSQSLQQIEMMANISQGDSTNAVVDLFLPYGLAGTIETAGSFGQVIEIINSDEMAAPSILKIQDYGIGNQFYVTSSASPVEYLGRGVSGYIEAKVKSGSVFEIGQRGVAKIDNLGTELDVTLSGVESEATIQGTYTTAKLSGLNSQLIASNCTTAILNGILTNCSESEENVTIMEPTCVSETTADLLRCNVGGNTVDSMNSTDTLDIDFTCGDYDHAIILDVGYFDSVAPEGGCSSDKGELLVPQSTHWHIYIMGAESEPKYAVFPPGIIEPYVVADTLRFRWNQSLEGVSVNDPVYAAVDLFLPYTYGGKIETSEPYGEIIQIINTNSSAAPDVLQIFAGGIGNSFYVNSPASPVEYIGKAVSGFIEAEVMSGSIFEMTQLNGIARIRNLGEELNVTMTGMNTQATIQGPYTSAKVTGANAQIFINDDQGCSNAETSVVSSCSHLGETVTVLEPSCVSISTAARLECYNGDNENANDSSSSGNDENAKDSSSSGNDGSSTQPNGSIPLAETDDNWSNSTDATSSGTFDDSLNGTNISMADWYDDDAGNFTDNVVFPSSDTEEEASTAINTSSTGSNSSTTSHDEDDDSGSWIASLSSSFLISGFLAFYIVA